MSLQETDEVTTGGLLLTDTSSTTKSITSLIIPIINQEKYEHHRWVRRFYHKKTKLICPLHSFAVATISCKGMDIATKLSKNKIDLVLACQMSDWEAKNRNCTCCMIPTTQYLRKLWYQWSKVAERLNIVRSPFIPRSLPSFLPFSLRNPITLINQVEKVLYHRLKLCLLLIFYCL